MDTTLAGWEELDIVVNNAGVGQWDRLGIGAYDLDEWSLRSNPGWRTCARVTYPESMQRSASLTTMSTILAVLALVAHLWMLDAPHSTLAESTGVTFAPTHAALPMSGCASGMSACQVSMPEEPPGGVELLPLVGLLGLVVLAARRAGALALPRWPERGPPRRPYVPSSVVLLI